MQRWKRSAAGRRKRTIINSLLISSNGRFTTSTASRQLFRSMISYDVACWKDWMTLDLPSSRSLNYPVTSGAIPFRGTCRILRQQFQTQIANVCDLLLNAQQTVHEDREHDECEDDVHAILFCSERKYREGNSDHGCGYQQ